jgi:hypothetical protein
MLAITRQCRANFLSIINSHSTEQLNAVPEGYNNNLIWNFVHVIVTQQLLTYGLSELPLKLDKTIVQAFRKGSRPESSYASDEIDHFKSLATTTLDQFEADMKAGLFTHFKPYATSFGFRLNSLEEAIAFNDVHEGLHLGYAMSMRKRVD